MGRGGEGEAVEVDRDGRGVPFADMKNLIHGEVVESAAFAPLSAK